MHPDVLHFAAPWHSYAYWMAMTPYPGGDDEIENPSIVASNDGYAWEVPAGLTNPVTASPAGIGYNADPDLVYNDDTDELWMYYLSYPAAVDDKVYMALKKSSDGVTWGSATTCITWDISALGDNERAWGIIKQGANWYYWAQTNIAPHKAVYRTSGDGITWSAATNVVFSPIPAKFPWHLNVIYVASKSQYWMMFNDDSNASAKNIFATSTDRINWTAHLVPAMRPSASGWDNGGLYRSCIIYEEASDLLRCWYSARNASQVWGTGYAERNYSDFLGSLALTITTLQPDATAGIDTNLDASNPTQNFGISTSITAGQTAAIFRGLLKFDLAIVPLGSPVNSGIVTLVCTSESAITDRNVGLHRCLTPWFEGVKLGAAPDASQDGSTWNLRNANGSVAWGAAGGLAGTDYVASATATTLITAPGSFTWDVTMDIAGFVTGAFPNYGWFVINTAEATANSRKLFGSSDNATPANRPALAVTYQELIWGALFRPVFMSPFG